jgi:uncharacterized repeat protein (TIGR01451 family)
MDVFARISAAIHVRAIRFVVLFTLACASAGVVRADGDLPSPSPHLEVIPAGSLVIPMDNARQNLGGAPFNLKSYGLVTQLLWNNIPVKWAIRAGKAKDTADFTASASRVWPSSGAVGTVAFAGGPFIVPRDWVAEAQAVITSFGGNVAVYKLTADVTVDVRFTLTHKPKLAVLNDGANAPIQTAIAQEAGLVSATQYQVISATSLTTINANSCFTVATEPHFDSPAAGPQAQAIREFLLSGANFLAQCVASVSYENNAAFGHFQTTAGIVANNVTSSSLLYPNADLPFAQFVGALYDASGSVQDYELAPASALQNSAHALVSNTAPTGVNIATASKLTAGAGSVAYYLGGHNYLGGGSDGALGTTLAEINGRRMYLNAILTPAVRPPPCQLNFVPKLRIAGHVLEDVDGDGALGDAVRAAGVGVRLYADGDDDGDVGTADTFVAATTTDATGLFAFQPDASVNGYRYLVTVDSKTVPPSAGFNTGWTQSDVWAEQTYGDNPATSALDLGPRRGGRDPSVPDRVDSSNTSPSANVYEHVARVDLSGGAVGDVEFAFSFRVIANTIDGPDVDTSANRTRQGSLRQLVQNADAIAGAARATIPAGTYVLTLEGIGEDLSRTGDLDVTDDLTLDGVGRASTILDGNGLDRVIDVPATSIVNLSGLTIRNGLSDKGAGLAVAAGTTTLTRITVSGCHATGRGGGLHTQGATLILSDVVVTGNRSDTFGGGMANQSGAATLTDVTISGNTAADSGGGYAHQSNAGASTLNRVTISGNTATSFGGGLYAQVGANSLTNVTVSGNNATNGGGLYNGAGTLALMNVTIAGNTAVTSGAAIHNAAAATGITLKNTIVSSTPSNDNCFGPLTDQDQNLDNGNSCGFSLSGDLTNTDPLLGPLQDNGGSTATHALLAGSPVIDKGSNIGCPAVDQRTSPRPLDGDGDGTATCDMGAVEGTAAFITADLSVAKDDGVTSYTPGGSVNYKIVVRNGGPNNVTGARVVDTPPGAIAGFTWTCAESGGASCMASGTGNINDTVNLPPDGAVTYTVVASIAPSANGNLVNTATVTAPAGASDRVPANNTATDTDTQGPSISDLGIAKTDGVTSYTPGATMTYKIGVTNAGPGDAVGATVNDTFPAAVASASWTCVPSTGASCTASGTGNINRTVNVPVGGKVTYTVTATIASSATGNLVNTATVTAPAGATDPVPASNTATDTDIQGASISNLGITKTDGVTTYTPGGTVTYTILVNNAGPSDAVGATVKDTFPAAVASAAWTCVHSAGASCTASGTGNINQTVNVPVGGKVTYTVTATTASSATGNLVNTATVAAPAGTTDPSNGNNSATDTDTKGPSIADLGITKTDGLTSYTPGATTTYAIVVTNAGPSNALGATVSDVFPATISGAAWTCAPSAGASCPASGTGNINHTVTVPAGGSLTYTVTASIAAAVTGDLVNTATVSTPNGTNDPVSSNDSATDIDAQGASIADLAIAKSDGVASYTPGGTLIYTIVVTNAGPSSATGATVRDLFPAAVTGVSWTCAKSPGASCTGNGTGDINDTVKIPAGGNVTYTVTATVGPLTTGNLVNTATITAPAGATDPTPGNNSATDTDAQGAPVTELAVAKTDGVTTYTPGGTVTYSISVVNGGPSNAIGATVADALPAIVSGAAWTCAPGAGATCSASGAGDINDTVNIPAGKSVVYTLTATISPSAATNLVNTAIVGVPAGTTDPSAGNNSATDTDTRGTPVANLGITKTDGVATYTPGATTTYTIVVQNAGPSDVTGATVKDTVPAIVAGATWTCVPSAGASCTASGLGNINDTVAISAGKSVTYTVLASIAPSASGNLVNTATVEAPAGTTDPSNGNNSETDTDTKGPSIADLGITKTDGLASYTPGTTTTYAIVVTNAGPSNAAGATVSDVFPAIVSGAAWTCAPSAGASCPASGTGNINQTVTVPAGGSLTYTVTASIAAEATGDLVNTATVAVPTGATDPFTGNDSATDTDAQHAPVADLGITKTDNVSSYTPGGTLDYTIVVSNAGPSSVVGAAVSDVFPAAVTSASFTCAPSTGASCAASGVGNIADTVNVPAGGRVTYTVTASIASSATGDLVNTATVAAPTSATDPVPGNNSATDTDTKSISIADLGITKTDNVASYTPGGTLTYKIVVTNAGPSDVAGAAVQDVFPAAVAGASFTCLPSAGASCTASGTGNINDVVNVPAGTSVTYTVVATIASSAAGNLVNSATIGLPSGVGDPVPANNTATDTDTLGAPIADLGITKTDGVATYTPGATTTYTIVVQNAGPSDATGVTVKDTFPAIVSGATWTCVPSAGGSCTASGTGNVNDSVAIPAGGSVTYTVVASIAPSASGNLVNTATVAAPPGATDPSSGNNSATDTDAQGAPVVDLGITKSDNVASYTPGTATTYTIVVTNAGPGNAAGATVSDVFPAAVTGASWTCAPSAGASCAASGTGNINQTVNVPAGASLTYTVNASIASSASGDLVNTATVTSAAGATDLVPANNTATDADTLGTPIADLGITKTDSVLSYTPGGTLTYKIVVTNAGPSDVTGAAVNDIFPTNVASASWTCAPSAGASCTASGVGNIADTVNVPAGGKVTYTVSASIAPSATGDIVNTATVEGATSATDPVPANDAATDTDTQGTSLADLGIAKTDGVTTYVPGTTTTYTIFVTNAGPSNAVGAIVSDVLPAAVTSASWTCAPSAGASCAASGTGDINDPVSLPANGSATYTVTAAISPSATGPLVNTATVAAPASANDPVPGNNTATDTDTRGALIADLGITKTDGVPTYAPGTTTTYTIVVTNAGPSNVVGATVSDVLPAAVSSASWTCAPSAGASCAPSGTGNINQTVTVPVGGSLTYTVVASIASSASLELVNTATIAVPAGATDPVPDNNEALDNDARNATADLSLTQSVDDGSPRVGEPVLFALTISNSGPSDATGIQVSDPLPSGYVFASDDAAASGTTYDPATGLWSAGSLAAGANKTLYLRARVVANGTWLNAAQVSAAAEADSDSTPGNGTGNGEDDEASVATTPTAALDLSLSKMVDIPSPAIGINVVFTLTVTNAAGLSDATGVVVTDALPAGFTYVSDDASSTATSYDAGTGAWTVGTLPSGTSMALHLTARVRPSGPWVNVAQVVAAGEPDVDSTPGNGTGHGEDDEASVSAAPPGHDGTIDVTASMLPGQVVTVTVSDPDLDFDAVVAESLSLALVDEATGEMETTTLIETGPATGIFVATVATAYGTAAGASNDGVLVVQASHRLTATYLDERTAAGGSVTRTDTGIVAGGADGRVELPATLPAGDPLAVTVTDADLNANASVAESVTVTVQDGATGETESVVLTETGPATGIFTETLGTILGSAAGVPGDGVLVVRPGDSLTATSLDALTATGGTVTRTASSLVVADVIRLDKRALNDEVIIGEIVGFVVTATNTASSPIPGVILEDALPPGFKLVKDSARLMRAGLDAMLGTADDTTTVLTTTGVRPVLFGPIDFAARELVQVTYLVRAGAGAVRGRHVNSVVPSAGGVPVGNTASASVTLVADPVFDGCRVLGKVFEDVNSNGVQDENEPGVAGALVALDNGMYSVTDGYGRYHLPDVLPGQRMVKLDVGSLPAGSHAVGDDSRILWLTPGLTGRADFPVITPSREESIGSPGVPGLWVESAAEHDPIAIQGKAEQMSVLVNDRLVDLASADVQIQTKTLDDVVVLAGNKLKSPVSFELAADAARGVAGWSLTIRDGAGATAWTLTGNDPPPKTVAWDGTSGAGGIVRAGEIYQYQLEVTYRDGSVARSAKRLLGVNRDKVVSVELRGEAFASGKTELSGKARQTLAKVAEMLREYPDEKILIEGHTDSVGTPGYNLDLSRRRAEAARDYFATLGVPIGRTMIQAYGRERPIAPNDIDAGREMNRRVEVKSQLVEVQSTEITERYRTEPSVHVNGSSVELGELGRFSTQIDGATVRRVDLEVADSQGRVAKTAVDMPRLDLDVPATLIVSPTSPAGSACTMAPESGVVRCLVRGRTDPGSSVLVDGRPVALDADGAFAIEQTLVTGENAVGVLVRNAQGYSHTANLVLRVSERDAQGNLVVATAAIPRLTLRLPPDGSRLDSGVLAIVGATDPGNRVYANETALVVNSDGAISGSLTLPAGTSKVVVRVEDPAGLKGEIASTYEVPPTRLFLLAFANGEFGQLKGKGYIEGAGLDAESSSYTDGRLAVYLKGRIAGKYLIAAAFDSGRADADRVFGDLDNADQRKLLTNLDPDRYYTVYGDESTTVFDVETQGKFYLALDGETIHAVVGNYPIAFSGTELSAYQRTLYGGRFLYRSAKATSRGEPNTEVVVFGAEVRQGHMRDELSATGGSLYYLSHKDVIEGSERVTLVVRDKNTGLELSRVVQRQNFDYTVKYSEGRVVFNRPVSSVVDGGSLTNERILQGNPVYLQIDYEAILQDFEKTAVGGRVVQRIGEQVALGGTYVQDELQSGPYTLKGVDAEARLNDGTRLTAEYATSSGSEAVTFVSADGGLSYAPTAAAATQTGSAWKAGAEFDVGRWFKTPDRYTVKLYYRELEPGFSSNGTFLEQGTTKIGASAELRVTAKDTIGVHLNREERTGPGSLLPGTVGTTDLESLQYEHAESRWGVVAEYFNRNISDDVASMLKGASYATGRAWMKFGEKITGRLEHQQTLSGPDNNQTTAGVRYQILKNLGLDAQATYGSIGTSAQAGAVLDFGGSSVYLNERLTDGAAGEHTTTILGARSPLGRGSSVYTEYQWETADAGDKAVSLVGLQRQWEPGRGWKFVFSGESARVNTKTQDTNRTALAAGITFTSAEKMTFASRSEIRFESGLNRLRQILTSNQFDYKFGQDLTLQARYRYSDTENRDSGATEARIEDSSLGLAFRPVANDRFNALARYSHVNDQGPVPAGVLAGSSSPMDIVSFESVFAVTPRVEWLGKAAFRLQKDRVAGFDAGTSKTFLTIQRFNFVLWKALELGAEYRLLTESATESRRQGVLTQLSWRLIKMMRLGVGYNFTDFSDNEYSRNDYSVHGWFFRVQGRY